MKQRPPLRQYRVARVPLSAYPLPPDCLVAADVVDRPAYGLADTTPAACAQTPVLRRAAIHINGARSRGLRCLQQQDHESRELGEPVAVEARGTAQTTTRRVKSCHRPAADYGKLISDAEPVTPIGLVHG